MYNLRQNTIDFIVSREITLDYIHRLCKKRTNICDNVINNIRILDCRSDVKRLC